MKSSQGQRWWFGWSIRKKVGFVLFVVTAVVMAALLFYGAFDQEGDDETVETVVTPTSAATQTIETPPPTPTPRSLPVPVLLKDYQVGEVFSVPSTYLLGETEPGDPEGTCFYPYLHVHQGDLVEIIGEAQLLNRSEQYWSEGSWFWRILVVQGGYYVEGKEWWLYDGAPLLQVASRDRERPVPEFEVGDVVWPNYNFIVAKFPGGPPAYYDEYGNEVMIYGGPDQEVTIIASPTQIEDGHYWCGIRRPVIMGYDSITEEALYFEAWMPCELQWPLW
jgi:hypothetical protein